MKITYSKKNKKGVRQINLYQKNTDKKIDGKGELFTNMKVPEKLSQKAMIRFVRSMVQRAKTHKLERVALDYNQMKKYLLGSLDEQTFAELFVKNLMLAEYSFDAFKTKKDTHIQEIIIIGDFSAQEKKAFQYAELIAKNINQARDLANTPGNHMTPSILAQKTKKLMKGSYKTKVKVLDEKEIKKLGMGLMEAVGRASSENSKFIIVEYQNGAKNDKPIVLVGKGVTFDAGGLDIKPSGKFVDMYMDMTGATIALGTIKTLADLKVKKNIVVLIPAVENFVSGDSYRPGDIITSLSGKTVMIGHTDAEGRLVMADGITYAERYQPKMIIDIATLTGASLVAVGQNASVIMTKDEQLPAQLKTISERVGEYVWELPTWDEYTENLKSDFADISNISNVRYGGTITAGMFLYEFVKMHKKEPTWLHIDIAPRMESIKIDNLAKGATGEPIALLVELLKK